MTSYESWMRQLATTQCDLELPASIVSEEVQKVITTYFTGPLNSYQKIPVDQFAQNLQAWQKDVLFSKENEEVLTKRFASLKRELFQKKTPQEFIEKRLKAEFGTEKAEEIFSKKLLPDLNNLFDLDANKIQTSQLDEVVAKLREVVNVEELKDLHTKLKISVGEKLANEIMNDWRFIGIDIKYNQSVLSAERKKVILERAKQAQEKEKQFEKMIEQLKQDLAKDLPANEKVVEAKYSNLNALIRSLPESRNITLKQVMARALVIQQLRNPAAFKGSSTERRILNELGYDTKDYEDRKQIELAMQNLLHDILSQNELKSVQGLKKEMQVMAFHVRMDAAHVPKNYQENIQTLCDICEDLKERALNNSSEMISSYEKSLKPDLPENGAAFKFLMNNFLSICQGGIEKKIFEFIGNKKNLIRNYLSDTKTFKYQILSLSNNPLSGWELDSFINKSFSVLDTWQKAVNWFKKYQPYVVVEFQQGGDEALGGGVCLAMVHRVAKEVLLNRKIGAKELKTNHILPTDRLYESMHLVANQTETDLRKILLPPVPLFRQGLKEEVLFRAKSDQMEQAIRDHIDTLQASHGGLKLYFDRHATFLRMDVEEKECCFFDPNFCTLSLPYNDEKPLETLNLALKCYRELREWAYTEGEWAWGVALRKCKEGEKPPVDFNPDGDKISVYQ